MRLTTTPQNNDKKEKKYIVLCGVAKVIGEKSQQRDHLVGEGDQSRKAGHSNLKGGVTDDFNEMSFLPYTERSVRN